MGKYTACSLFCGAGGLDIGFHRAGIETVWANDFNEDACRTHRLWSGADVVCEDISAIPSTDIPDADVFLGGFPCQGFSLSGPRKLDDSRNRLYQQYVRILKGKRPLAFVGENVKGLLSMGRGEIFEAIVQAFYECGYAVFHALLNAKDYAVPEDRLRVILVGFRLDLGISYFDFPMPEMKAPTMEDAFGDFPRPDESDVCQDSYSSRYLSRNRRRGWNEPSFTIPAMAKQVPLWPGSPEMVKIDADHWRFGEGETRRLSWQEAAAVQTFPKDMEFCGDLRSRYRQIGNAVPCALAERIAKSVASALDGQKISS